MLHMSSVCVCVHFIQEEMHRGVWEQESKMKSTVIYLKRILGERVGSEGQSVERNDSKMRL